MGGAPVVHRRRKHWPGHRRPNCGDAAEAVGASAAGARRTRPARSSRRSVPPMLASFTHSPSPCAIICARRLGERMDDRSTGHEDADGGSGGRSQRSVRFKVGLPARPRILGARSWSTPLCLVVFVAGRVGLTVFDYFLSWPRFAFWIPLTAIASIAILKSRRLTPKFLVTLTAVAELLEVIDYFIYDAREHRLGYTNIVFDPWTLLATVGAVGLATTVAVTFDESIRATVIASFLKDGEYSIVPLVAVFLMISEAGSSIPDCGSTNFSPGTHSPSRRLRPGPQALKRGLYARSHHLVCEAVASR